MYDYVNLWYDSLNDAIAHAHEYYTLEPYCNRFGEYYYAYIDCLNDLTIEEQTF
jgi:hypothetical protein